MKKKFLVPVLCAAFVCSAIAFTACGETDNGDKGTGGVVTAEEWAQAMDFEAVDNFTFTLGSSDSDYTAICKYDGLKWYWNEQWRSNENAKSGRSADDSDMGSPAPPDNPSYSVSVFPNNKEGEGYYEITEKRSDEEGGSIGKEYEYKNGKWTYETVDGIHRFGDMFTMYISALRFDAFTYDEEKDCYFTDQELSSTTERGVGFWANGGGEVQFKNKQVARIQFFAEIEGIQYAYEIKFFDYGTTKVTLPTVA